MKSRYTIGEAANIYGISPQLLRHYEQEGMIHSQRDSNGYRWYTLHDLKRMSGIRRFRSFGFSLNDANHLFRSESMEESQGLLLGRLAELEEELRWKNLVHQTLIQLLELSNGAETELNSFRFIEMKPYLRMKIYENGEFLSPTEGSLRFRELIPVTNISPGFALEDIRAGNQNCSFYLALPLKIGQELNLTDTPCAEVVSGGRCITTVITSQEEEHIHASQLTSLVEYAVQQGFTPAEHIWGITLFPAGGQKYHRMFLPIT